jgi:hypothetical protein
MDSLTHRRPGRDAISFGAAKLNNAQPQVVKAATANHALNDDKKERFCLDQKVSSYLGDIFDRLNVRGASFDKVKRKFLPTLTIDSYEAVVDYPVSSPDHNMAIIFSG